MEVSKMVENIHWLGHDSFRIDGPATIYVDPWQLPAGVPQADLVLVTHDHYDHCSPEDVAKISKADTVIVTIAAAAKKLKGDVRVVKPGDSLTVKGIPIEVVPAYNVNKKFHPRDAGHVGFIITVDGQRIYHAGDTDFIPEMKDFKVDIALLPVSGTYVMTADEAANAAKAINPKVAIPMHYGEIVGSRADAERFRELYGGEVVILPLER
ncbi:MAG: MBL fold metallo-hydrolase [Anaerolineae bacterium]|nr:MBL fold metallo-hydrolase [Anaerolineae bacterium]